MRLALAPTLDRIHLVQQTDGDSELQRELLGLFAHQCATLEPVVVSGTPGEQAMASHALKGAALAVGAFRVAAAADAIEAATDGTGAFPATDDLVRVLRAALVELRAELARFTPMS